MTSRVRLASRRTPRQARARETVTVVLDATVRLLSQGGRDLTTNRVADVAGVSIGSLYQYFPNKQAIFSALHDRHIEQATGALERTFEAHARSPLPELLRALFEVAVETHTAKPNVYERLDAEAPRDGAVSRAYAARLSNGLRDAARRCLAPSVDVEGVAFMLSRQLDALTHSVILQRPSSVSRELAEAEALRALTGYLSTLPAKSE